MSDVMILIWGHDVGRAGVGAVRVLLGHAGERTGHGVVIQRGWWRWQGDGDGGGMERAAVVAWRGQRQWHGEGGSGGTEKVGGQCGQHISIGGQHIGAVMHGDLRFLQLLCLVR